MSRADNELCPHCNECHHPMTLCADARKAREPCSSCADLRAELAQARADRDEAREMEYVGNQIAASFFGALKPLNLPTINIVDPGAHVTDLIRDLAACRAALRELVEAVRTQDRLVYEGAPGQIAARKRLDAALARAKEEAKRDV